MTVRGLQRLERRIKAIPAHVRAAMRESMARTADEIVARMKRKVVEDTGTLEASIDWTWGQAPKGTTSLIQARADGLRADDTITIFAGGDPTSKRVHNKLGGAIYEYDYALAVEFGTKNMQAHPFFFVTWKAMKRVARNRQRKAVRDSIKKAA